MQRNDFPSPARSLDRWAAVVVRLAGGWVLAGGLMKLFRGSPSELPPVVRQFPLDLELTFQLAITVELVVGFLALIQPRLGWKLLVLQLGVFLAVLVQMVASKEKSCRCFGPDVSVPPWVMIAIDGSLLAAILATRPWITLRGEKPRLALSAVAIVVACVAPWFLLPEQPPAAPVANASGEWRLPAEIPRYVRLEPETWVGKPIAASQLALWMDVSKYDGDSPWILYRITCEHCAEHLRKLANDWASDPKLYVFVRLTEPDEEAGRQVELALEAQLAQMGQVATLPRPNKGYVITTPWELILEGGIVKSATFLGEEQTAE